MISLYLLLMTISYTNSEETTTSTSSNVTILYQVPTKTTDNDTAPQNNPPMKETKNSFITTWETQSTQKKESKPSTTAWKIETSYAESNLTEVREDNSSELKEDKVEKQEIKEFRPSQHLGSFFDEEDAEVIKKPNFGLVKKPASGFVSSPKDEFYSTHRKPFKQIYQTHKEFPYKFENPDTKAKGNWHIEDSMESRPTVEIPVKIPAGGFYESPGAFKEKPWSSEDFALVVEDGNEHGVKKRRNPWKSLLQLMTAFIPVGLIISALTPSLVTIESTGTGTQYPSNPFRRSDRGIADVAPISEDCRRRLLCELHSDTNYLPSPSAVARKKHCYRLQCEDTHALWRMLRWLLAYYQPGADDQKHRRYT